MQRRGSATIRVVCVRRASREFAQSSAGMILFFVGRGAGHPALIYFYAHYGFARITAHVTAMFIPYRRRVLIGRRNAGHCSCRDAWSVLLHHTYLQLNALFWDDDARRSTFEGIST